MNKSSRRQNLRIVEVRRASPDMRMLVRVLLIHLGKRMETIEDTTVSDLTTEDLNDTESAA